MSEESPEPITDDLGAPLPSVGKLPATKAKHARIIKAAKRHFAKHGYDEARMEDLAKNLGISKASIFQYFGTKSRLFLEALKNSASVVLEGRSKFPKKSEPTIYWPQYAWRLIPGLVHSQSAAYQHKILIPQIAN